MAFCRTAASCKTDAALFSLSQRGESSLCIPAGTVPHRVDLLSFCTLLRRWEQRDEDGDEMEMPYPDVKLSSCTGARQHAEPLAKHPVLLLASAESGWRHVQLWIKS